ncbi:GNAT family N-acetyltransferase [Streptomyces sp. NBC_00536]|uniref:GNAT family N-acetyltransferase n=1 Tax=Streptomyces sp. NBC_00536 TaxID=2975769 RepID=UPI002E809411|nr:GNAT family protein [Streptomyces sp. NBC_00536]WUC82173.1 GNAT family N-acetyltransferase [Streptomyces sp. NBC_00536]
MPDLDPLYLAAGPRVGLRRIRSADGPEFIRRTRESRELHRPWLFPPGTPEEYAAYAARLTGADGADEARAGFLVCERDGGAIAGFVNVNNIVRGAFQCGALGYGAFAHAADRGLMTEGVGLLLRHALTGPPTDEAGGPHGPAPHGSAPHEPGPRGLDLHRLEVNVQPGNAASIALVRRLGFRLEGLSPAFLRVDGAWRDHERWAITREMLDPAVPHHAG